jgi:hypothetical protein
MKNVRSGTCEVRAHGQKREYDVDGNGGGVAFRFVMCCSGYLNNGKVLAVAAARIYLSPDAIGLVSDGSLFAEPNLS